MEMSETAMCDPTLILSHVWLLFLKKTIPEVMRLIIPWLVTLLQQKT